MVLNFIIIQALPGGPVEQILAKLDGTAVGATARFGGQAGSEAGEQRTTGGLTREGKTGTYRGAQGLDPELIAELQKQFGFDKPAHVRFFIMLQNYVTFDFGDSFFKDRPVVDLVVERFPVSISLGLWTMFLIYLTSIPLGIAKAVRDGSRFDVWTSGIIITGNAVPSFLFAILLIVLFAGGRYFGWFPLRGLLSTQFSGLGFLGCATTLACVTDYFWHLALPITAMVIGGFAGVTLLTKNSFLDQIHQQYVITARAKGLTERRVLYGHVFRNGMLILIAGFPGTLIGILFTGNLLIEMIFSIEGLGLLGYEAIIERDYPIVFGTLYVLTLIGLFLHLISDLTYMFIDPRIDFESRGT